MEIGSEKWKNLIIEGAAALFNQFPATCDLRPAPQTLHLNQFALHAIELLKWNQKINLTAITDPAEIAVKHFIDSIAPVPLIPHDASSMLDIGSGGGFPGIPIKIMLPSLSVTLIDSSRKKVSFQKHIIRTLRLENTEAVHTRAEELAENPLFSNAFDLVICRAFSALDKFVLTALPFLAKDGIIIALKGKVSESELKAVYSIPQIDKEICSVTVQKQTLPYIEAERSVFCLKFRK